MAYLKFIVDLGSQNRPDETTICAIAQLTRSVGANRNREFVTRVWVDTEGTSYSAEDAGNLASAVRASTIVMHWPLGENTEAPVDGPMRTWISARMVSVPDSAGFVDALRYSKYPVNSHPFNVLTALSVRGGLDVETSNALQVAFASHIMLLRDTGNSFTEHAVGDFVVRFQRRARRHRRVAEIAGSADVEFDKSEICAETHFCASNHFAAQQPRRLHARCECVWNGFVERALGRRSTAGACACRARFDRIRIGGGS